MRFLIFGDVVGSAGRTALSTALPQLRQEHQPDAVIINIENMAHGRGITPSTMAETAPWHADAFTTGDHAWDNSPGIAILNDPAVPIIRPANYPAGLPGRGYLTWQCGAYRVALLNLQGQVFFKNDPDNPFQALDTWLTLPDVAAANIRLVDFHAGATSEMRAFGWHADGKISAMWGTHTHVPTADAQILPDGTGYITDVGMVGLHHSVIGADAPSAVKRFLTQLNSKLTYDATGAGEIGALLIDVDPATSKTTHIKHIRQIVD